MEKPKVREDTIKSIQEAVAHLFGLSVEQRKQESTRREVAVPRQIAIYLAKQMTDASLPEIGRHFGRKHHTTVMYSIAKIHDRRRTDAHLNHTNKAIITKAGSGSEYWPLRAGLTSTSNIVAHSTLGQRSKVNWYPF
jgi:chromosomal replication initiator protein